LPPIEDRQGISDFLDALEDRITLLRETNATLEAIAQGLFKSWFVDFDRCEQKWKVAFPKAWIGHGRVVSRWVGGV
jgi:type I restriction enzyme S subunit